MTRGDEAQRERLTLAPEQRVLDRQLVFLQPLCTLFALLSCLIYITKATGGFSHIFILREIRRNQTD